MNVEEEAGIRIPYQDLVDLIARRTGNPIAEAEVPGRLEDAIQSGTVVILTDVDGNDSIRLLLKGGNFVYVPVA